MSRPLRLLGFIALLSSVLGAVPPTVQSASVPSGLDPTGRAPAMGAESRKRGSRWPALEPANKRGKATAPSPPSTPDPGGSGSSPSSSSPRASSSPSSSRPRKNMTNFGQTALVAALMADLRAKAEIEYAKVGAEQRSSLPPDAVLKSRDTLKAWLKDFEDAARKGTFQELVKECFSRGFNCSDFVILTPSWHFVREKLVEHCRNLRSRQKMGPVAPRTMTTKKQLIQISMRPDIRFDFTPYTKSKYAHGNRKHLVRRPTQTTQGRQESSAAGPLNGMEGSPMPPSASSSSAPSGAAMNSSNPVPPAPPLVAMGFSGHLEVTPTRVLIDAFKLDMAFSPMFLGVDEGLVLGDAYGVQALVFSEVIHRDLQNNSLPRTIQEPGNKVNGDDFTRTIPLIAANSRVGTAPNAVAHPAGLVLLNVGRHYTVLRPVAPDEAADYATAGGIRYATIKKRLIDPSGNHKDLQMIASDGNCLISSIFYLSPQRDEPRVPTAEEIRRARMNLANGLTDETARAQLIEIIRDLLQNAPPFNDVKYSYDGLGPRTSLSLRFERTFQAHYDLEHAEQLKIQRLILEPGDEAK